jgi:hypothetical protein
LAKKKQKHSNKPKPDKEYKENPLFNYLLIFLFTIFLILLTTFKISGDDDVFWHLATGRYVVENFHVPSADVFGFITEGQEWMPFEWGWDVLTYGLYNAGGYTAISIFRTLIFLSIFFIFFVILRKFKISNTIIFIFFILLSFGIIDRLTPRPHIISLLFFAILLYLIIEYRYFSRNNKMLYFIPLIFLLWANMHMGILAGLFLFGLYVLSEIIVYFKRTKSSGDKFQPLSKDDLVRLTIIFFVSVLMMFINPNFYQTYIYAYSHTKMKLLETINEWRSPFDTMYGDGFVVTIYKIFLFSGILILYYSIKKKDPFPVLVYIGFAIYSVRAIRFTVDYIVIITIFLALSVDFILSNFKGNSLRNFIEKNPVPKLILSVLLVFFIINLPDNKLYLDHMKYYRISGFGINEDFIPVQLFDFMKENNITEIGERPLNHFGTGGFLVWNFPHARNFIDSRNLNDEIFNEYNSIISRSPGFQNKIDKYDLDYAIYLAPDLVRMPQEMEQTIISYFEKSDDWKLVFWDDKSFLFLKNIPKFNHIIESDNYKYLTPYNIVYQPQVIEQGILADKEAVVKEARRKLEEEPGGIIIGSFMQKYGNKILN